MKLIKNIALKIINNFLRVQINLLKHNGVSIEDYPDKKWKLVPFPSQKGDIYNADNLATVNRHDFTNCMLFANARKSAEKRWGTPGNVRDISWRLHVLLWAFGNANKEVSQGEIAIELGTGKGYMAAAICEYFNSNIDKKMMPLYLFDVFSKNLELANGESIKSPAQFAYTDQYSEVVEYFKDSEFVKVVRGLIPEVLTTVDKRKIGFLHLDLNNAESEKLALEYLAAKFIKGAIILLDDYGGPFGEAQAIAHKNFATVHGRSILELPTGQGLIIW